jgi:hypothetical protein
MLFLNKGNEGKIIVRRGSVSNDKDGMPLLINEKGEAYRVNDTAVSLWNMCNGISFDDLFSEVMRISSGNESDVRKSLDQMVRQFCNISVAELKDVRSISAVRKSGMRT